MPKHINPGAITAVKLVWEAGYRAARLGKSRECGERNPLLKKAFERGYDAYSKQIRSVKK